MSTVSPTVDQLASVASTADGSQARDLELANLDPLAREVPNIDSAIAEIARLSAELTLPKGTIHVISDIHGEDKKLRHVINNASGTLRPLVERLFKDRMLPDRFQEILTLIFYPAEVVDRLEQTLRDPQEQKTYAMRTLDDLFDIVRVLAARRSLDAVTRVLPEEYRELLAEILHAPSVERDPAYIEAIVDQLVRRGRVLHLIHLIGRVIRNLAIDELIIAGDCWDRGPRGDHVVDYLMQQPNVSFIWGNHDVAWLGACLGHEALICNVLRISIRYRRLLQLEEGYGIPVEPLDLLARTVYADDPATSFEPRGSGMREKVMMARMQKAAAVMQFKFEGQVIARHPEWKMEHRRLLHRINSQTGKIEVDGVEYPLKEVNFPTINPANPYELTAEERLCVRRLRNSFLGSQKLWKQMRWMIGQGYMYLRREEHLIFHGCVPVDEAGDFLPMIIDGKPYTGRALFKAIESVIYRVLESRKREDLDLLWYLWSGPESPLFGKDRITTLESSLIADKRSHQETKNPYFRLIHESWFCEKILAEFGVDPAHGLIVNGHVPVEVEKGESPLKKSGKAITIDGAFSESLGDHGFTLVLEPHRTFLARHYHFESVEAAILRGADIIPSITVVREWDRPRTVADSQRGRRIRSIVEQLERLITAYRNHEVRERRSG
ncbi:MAG: fructose-bisphosphatase class III [Verrucomicrobia bacterium]|nr:fructose-bisphosphatase class III [Verrucomicrobiota bacterium]MBV8379128.1 fructose-bisphosphatase class III [Verrucomicrobiota bacterium]